MSDGKEKKPSPSLADTTKRSSLCSNITTVAVAVKVGASSKILWEVISDLSKIPEVLSAVLDFELVIDNKAGDKELQQQGDGCPQVGTQWKETRAYRENRIIQLKSVLEVTIPLGNENGDNDHQPPPNGEECYSLKFGISYPDLQGIDLMNVSTLTIQPINSSSCHLLGSFVVHDRGWFSTIRNLFCAKHDKAMLEQSFLNELEEYASAAEGLAGHTE